MRADKEIARARFFEVKAQIENELRTLPEIPAHPQGIPFDAAYTLVSHLIEILRHAHDETPAQANQFLRTLLQRVLFDGERITHIEWAEPFTTLERMNDRA